METITTRNPYIRYAEKYGITLQCEKVSAKKVYMDRNGYGLLHDRVSNRMNGILPNKDYYREYYICTLKMPYKDSYTCYYSQGVYTEEDKPTLNEFLEALKIDLSLEATSFESFCDSLGYEKDSMRAYTLFEFSQREYEKVKNFLGDLYDELMAIEDC